MNPQLHTRLKEIYFHVRNDTEVREGESKYKAFQGPEDFVKAVTAAFTMYGSERPVRRPYGRLTGGGESVVSGMRRDVEGA